MGTESRSEVGDPAGHEVEQCLETAGRLEDTRTFMLESSDGLQVNFASRREIRGAAERREASASPCPVGLVSSRD